MYIRELAAKGPLHFDEGDAYLAQIPAIARFSSLPLESPVCIFTGENGSGKSTLLEAIALCAGFNPEGGTINFHFSTRDTHSTLHERLRLVRGSKRPKDGFFLRAESFYNVSTQIDELDSEFSFGPPAAASYGGKSLHAQSHGEAFWSLVSHRFSGHGLYILDEPEAALSTLKQLALLRRIDELVHKQSQFIIATHSPILMAYPGACLYSFSKAGIEKTSYENIENVQAMQAFMQSPARMLSMMEIQGTPSQSQRKKDTPDE